MTNGWFQSDKPLWLPEGSIRALITLMLIGSFCALLIANVVYDIDKDRFHASLGVIETLTGAAFVYYFNQRNGRQPRRDASSPTLPVRKGQGTGEPTDR